MTVPRSDVPRSSPGSATIPGWIKFALPLVALTLMFALFEVGFRVVEMAAARPVSETWAVYDPDLGYRPKPSSGDNNADGLRDHPVTPKGGRFRILMLGDSVGYYGDSVDDTWVGQMRQELSRRSELAPTDVLNASVRGYTNFQEIEYLEKYGVSLEPDLVGIGFVLNDLHHILHRFQIKDGQIVGETYDFTPEAVQSVNSLAFRLARRSHFMVWLRHALDPAISGIQYRFSDGFSFDYRPDMSTAWQDAPWDAVKAQLKEAQSLGQERHFGLFMVVFPFADQYREKYLAANREYVLKPQTRATALCRELGIPCLDLFPVLDASQFVDDGIHLTPTGRQRVAQEVAAFLAKDNLVPQSR